MVTQLERIENELKLAGFNLEPAKEHFENGNDYAQAIGTAVYEVCKMFCSQGHSGYSASVAANMITKLLNGDVLSPLTNNPDEWMKLNKDDTEYQSKRKFSCFSPDLKQYYDINAEENKVYEVDESGKRTGYYHLKKERVMHDLTPMNSQGDKE